MHQQLKAALPARRSLGRMTYKQFLQWDGEHQHVEWVNGEVIEKAPISGEHADLSLFLSKVIDEFVAVRRLGTVRCEPFQMKTGPDLPGRSPDILFVATKHASRLKKTFVAGPADLVVEIVSPGTGGVDRGEKYYEYEKGGVREYWLVDPKRKQAEFYQLSRGGVYQLTAADARGVYRSKVVPGLWVRVDWLWREPLPTLTEVMKAWGAAE